LTALLAAVGWAIISLVSLNVVAFVLRSIPAFDQAYGAWLDALDVISIGVFAAEYALRLWSAVELPFLTHLPSWRARLRFALRPMQMFDLLAFVPSILARLAGAPPAVENALRLLRALKIVRYSSALQSLGRVLANERGALGGALLVMLGLLLFAATCMYLIEREAQPKVFGTIPDSLYWAVVTLATVGYGDAVPVTALGKLLTGAMILCGLAAFALPIGIIATAFGREVARRDFVVNWSLVARVPLFAGLDPAAVAQIMTLLYSRTFEAGMPIVRRGAAGDSMYFIASGEAVVEREEGEVRLGDGEFFGEMALLEGRARTHTVIASTRCRTLVLDREDFERLARRHPGIRKRVEEVAAERRSRNREEPPAA
ncbi:MAG: cyclic nucleotide-binding domain-containing protein, partial [Hyphomicrobiaceae bacterium]